MQTPFLYQNRPSRLQAGEVTLNKIAGGVALDNRLINGEFRFWQRQAPGSATSRSDDTYGPDRWYVLTQTAAINVERLAVGTTVIRYAARLTQAQATAQRFGLAQIIEGQNCTDLRAQAVTLFGKARCSAATTLRYAILGWTGTEDSVTSDVVSDWTSASFTAGGFFNSTTLSVLATGSVSLAAATWADISALSATIGGTVTNVVVVVWTDSAQAQNVTLDLANIGLVHGGVAPARYAPRQYGAELALCQRYYEKSFALEIAPAQNIGVGTMVGELRWPCVVTGAGSPTNQLTPFTARKRAAPTLTTFNPAAANAQVRNITDSADCSSTSAPSSENGFYVVTTTNAGAVPGEILSVHWTAEAEL